MALDSHARTAVPLHCDEAVIPLRVVKFLLSGGFAALVHSAGMYLLLSLTVGPHTAFLGGFVIAVVIRFFIDRHIVFEATQRGMAAQFLRYATACLLTYIVSATLFYLLFDVAYLHVVLAFTLSVVLTAIFAYAALNFALTGMPRKIHESLF
jgi:putative flippase GtrA